MMPDTRPSVATRGRCMRLSGHLLMRRWESTFVTTNQDWRFLLKAVEGKLTKIHNISYFAPAFNCFYWKILAQILIGNLYKQVSFASLFNIARLYVCKTLLNSASRSRQNWHWIELSLVKLLLSELTTPTTRHHQQITQNISWFSNDSSTPATECVISCKKLLIMSTVTGR